MQRKQNQQQSTTNTHNISWTSVVLCNKTKQNKTKQNTSCFSLSLSYVSKQNGAKMTTMQSELKNAFSKVGLKDIDEATMSKCEFSLLSLLFFENVSLKLYS
jgi:hypothetical protein